MFQIFRNLLHNFKNFVKLNLIKKFEKYYKKIIKSMKYLKPIKLQLTPRFLKNYFIFSTFFWFILQNNLQNVRTFMYVLSISILLSIFIFGFFYCLPFSSSFFNHFVIILPKYFLFINHIHWTLVDWHFYISKVDFSQILFFLS